MKPKLKDWKNLNLREITIPKRQYIGNHPQVDAIIKKSADENIAIIQKQFKDALNHKK